RTYRHIVDCARHYRVGVVILMKRIITREIKRGSLIQYALDGIKRESFEVIKRELASLLKHRAGVYALYQNDKLVRVGLGTNIYWRLKGHAKSKKLIWNNASLFIIGANNLKYLRDLETAIVRIAKPKYNDQQGRVRDEHFLERVLKKKVKFKRKQLHARRKQKDRELRELEYEIGKIEKVVTQKR
ncbi:MAG: hypothetical protein WA734_07165, partial [Candidatus Acidiferrales bacterium]